jgi:hypothetical protein
MKKILMGTGVLIGIYLAVNYYTGTVAVAGAGQNLFVGGVKVLQGR